VTKCNNLKVRQKLAAKNIKENTQYTTVGTGRMG